MKKGISLQTRLTLITSMLLTLLCVAFTIFGLYNLNVNVINPLQSASEIDMNNIDIQPAQQLTETVTDNLNDEIITKTIMPYSRFSFLFMLAAIVIGTGMMYFVSGLVLKPAKKLASDIAYIDKDTLSNRVTGFRAGDELSSIADSFNGMLDRLQSAFEREQRFSAAAAHELKTPLTIIKTNLDVFALDESPAKQDLDNILDVVKQQTNRMVMLVNDLMELSSKDVCDKNDVVPVDKLLAEIAEELSPSMIKTHVKLKIDAVPCNITANAVMLKHAISNIWSNAIRYNIEEGQISVSAYIEGRQCIICIEDTGIGIEEDKSKYIFEPFYRADKSRSRAAGGAGLGLAIAKEIITQHKGTVVYEKNEPRGSRFTVTLTIL